jgi:hypothetical protein
MLCSLLEKKKPNPLLQEFGYTSMVPEVGDGTGIEPTRNILLLLDIATSLLFECAST